MENLGGSLKMPQNRQKLVFGDRVNRGGRPRSTADKDVEGVFSTCGNIYCNIWSCHKNMVKMNDEIQFILLNHLLS